MLAFVNRLCLRLSLLTGIAHYYSRQRQCIWLKGVTSGNIHSVVRAYVDCDSDSLKLSVIVLGDGCSCHTLRNSCFYKLLW
ncbi:MAG: phosphoribosyl-AMP cyclohydrolase [Candidatus Hodgkinia cicadicola]